MSHPFTEDLSEYDDTGRACCQYCDLAAWLVLHGDTPLGESVANALETSLLANAAKLDGDRGQHPEFLEPHPQRRAAAQTAIRELAQVIGYVNPPLEESLNRRFGSLVDA